MFRCYQLWMIQLPMESMRSVKVTNIRSHRSLVARVDYSLARLQHYTATSAEYFQKFVLFTNYQFYIDEFCRLSRKLLNDGSMKYKAFVEPGNITTKCGDKNSVCNQAPGRLPQMPAYHLIGEDRKGNHHG